jgi:hypothetical protein
MYHTKQYHYTKEYVAFATKNIRFFPILPKDQQGSGKPCSCHVR